MCRQMSPNDGGFCKVNEERTAARRRQKFLLLLKLNTVGNSKILPGNEKNFQLGRKITIRSGRKINQGVGRQFSKTGGSNLV